MPAAVHLRDASEASRSLDSDSTGIGVSDFKVWSIGLKLLMLRPPSNPSAGLPRSDGLVQRARSWAPLH